MSNEKTAFTLYYTLGCHLCDDAEALILPICQHLSCEYQKKDIADDDALVDAYGIRIPVLLANQSQDELCWPFDQQTAFEFMEKQCRQ